MERFIAVDLGAGSGRVILGGLDAGAPSFEEVSRFRYPMERRDDHLRWPFQAISRDVLDGITQAAAQARAQGHKVRSVGVDTWGVDYGLLDGDNRLVEDPICYRDERTESESQAVYARVPKAELFARTGIQYLVFNTIFQLHAHVRQGLAPEARSILMMPDLLHHMLCGRLAIEYTNASTTQLLDARARDWDRDLIRRLGLPEALLPAVVAPGTDLGAVRPDLAEAHGLQGIRVVAPATHDTGSAVAGAPLADGWGYISSGTWSLVGVEREAPLTGPDVAAADFTNEGGVAGTIRFLKNVMGMWLLERCRAEWQAAGRDVAYESLLAAVDARSRDEGVLFFPDDQRLFNPDSMLRAIATQVSETGQTLDMDDAPAVTKAILDSLAFRYAEVVSIIQRLTGREIAGLQIVGGGSQNGYLNQMTADAAGKPVLAGPVEATALGNLAVQAITAGRFQNLPAARAYIRENTRQVSFAPAARPALAERRASYDRVRARFD